MFSAMTMKGTIYLFGIACWYFLSNVASVTGMFVMFLSLGGLLQRFSREMVLEGGIFIEIIYKLGCIIVFFRIA